MIEVPFSVLAAAKAFLCWDVMPDLSVQFIPIRQVAYYFPPNRKNHFISLFYDKGQKDFSTPLFLLFHEAGHAMQYNENKCDFDNNYETPSGHKRVEFEQRAWKIGSALFKKFVEHQELDPGLISEYERIAECFAQGYDKQISAG
jgi:hypothetical protein